MPARNSPESQKMKSRNSRGRWSFSGLWKGEGADGPSKKGKGPSAPRRSSSLSMTAGRPKLLRSHSDISQPELIKRTASVTGFTYRDPDSSDEETDYVPEYMPPSLTRKNSFSTSSETGSIRPPLERTRSLNSQDLRNSQRSSSGTHLSRTRSIDSSSDLFRSQSSSSGLPRRPPSGLPRDNSITRHHKKMAFQHRLHGNRLYIPTDPSRSSSRNGLYPPSELTRSVSRSSLNSSSRPGSFPRETHSEAAERQKREDEELRIATREEMEKAFGKFRLNPRLKDFVGKESPGPSRVPSPLGFQRSNSRLRSERVFGENNGYESNSLDLNGLPSITETSPVKASFPN